MAKNKNPELAPPAGASYPLVPSLLSTPQLPADDVADAFGTAIAGQPRNEPASIPLVRIDHRNQKFDYGGELLSEIEGYPIHWFQARAYWKTGYRPGEHQPPDCWSPHWDHRRKTGVPSEFSSEKQADTCQACPWSKFGSAAVGKGQACKTQTMVFVINPAFGTMPIICLILPPTSIRPLIGGARTNGYFQNVKNFKDPHSGRQARYQELAWTRWTLEQPAEGAIYCVVRPIALGVCPNKQEAQALADLRGRFTDMMESMRGEIAQPGVAVSEDAGE